MASSPPPKPRSAWTLFLSDFSKKDESGLAVGEVTRAAAAEVRQPRPGVLPPTLTTKCFFSS